MSEEPSEKELREAAEIALRVVNTWLSVEGPATSDAGRDRQLGAIRNLIAYLDRKVARASEAGTTVRTYETDLFGDRRQLQIPTFQQWSESQRGGDEQGK